MMRLSRSEGDDRLALHVSAAWLRRIQGLPERLQKRVDGTDFSDAVVRSLYPKFSDDPEVQADLESVASADLRERKCAQILAFARSCKPAEEVRSGVFRLLLPPAQVEEWISFLNDMRLMLAALLGLQTDEDADRLQGPPLPPRNSDAALYLLLTDLQGAMIHFLDGP